MRRRSTVTSSVVALVLVTLLPVQLVAHCDVPIPGLAHAEDHHPRSPDAPASGPQGAIGGPEDGGTCAFQAPLLTSRPDQGTHALPPPSEAAVGATGDAGPSVAALRLLPRGGSGQPSAPPLRI